MGTSSDPESILNELEKGIVQSLIIHGWSQSAAERFKEDLMIAAVLRVGLLQKRAFQPTENTT